VPETCNRRLKTPTKEKFDAGVSASSAATAGRIVFKQGGLVNRIVYIVGLIVIVIAILSFFGLR
jgi:hypothetical protein